MFYYDSHLFSGSNQFKSESEVEIPIAGTSALAATSSSSGTSSMHGVESENNSATYPVEKVAENQSDFDSDSDGDNTLSMSINWNYVIEMNLNSF